VWQWVVLGITGLLLKLAGDRARRLGFRRIESIVSSTILIVVPIGVGFLLMEEYIRYFDTPIVLAAGIGVGGVVAAWEILLHHGAKRSLEGSYEFNRFSFRLCRGLGVGFNFIVGVVLKIIYVLGLVLFPYLLNPNILTIFAVYAFFLADVLLFRLITARLGRRYGRNANLPRSYLVVRERFC
jgi:hypothetical protein